MTRPYLSIAAIVKDEAPYIEEWIAFHQLVGVEHFRIYDNCSTDNTEPILSTIPGVKVVRWEGRAAQLDAYHDALRFIRGGWVAFIDVDEFLFSPTYEPLTTVLRDYEKHPAVGACWAVYGTSGREWRQGMVTAGYSWRARQDNPINRHVKSIVQPAKFSPHRPSDPHHFRAPGVDEHERALDGAFAQSATWDILRVNHYVSKSIEEAKAKMARPRADTGQLRRMDLLSDDLNAVRDEVLWPYVPLTQARMAMTL